MVWDLRMTIKMTIKSDVLQREVSKLSCPVISLSNSLGEILPSIVGHGKPLGFPQPPGPSRGRGLTNGPEGRKSHLTLIRLIDEALPQFLYLSGYCGFLVSTWRTKGILDSIEEMWEWGQGTYSKCFVNFRNKSKNNTWMQLHMWSFKTSCF